MELKGSKTEQNLWTAFAGESQARNKYTYYASKAKKDGYEQIAALFEETATVPIQYISMVKEFTIVSEYVGEGRYIIPHLWKGECDE